MEVRPVTAVLQHEHEVARDVEPERQGRRVHPELAAQRRVYDQLAEHLPGSAVALFDTDLRLIVANGQSVRDEGNDPEAMVGRRVEDAVPALVWQIMEGPFRAALAGETTSRSFMSPYNGRQYRNRVRPVRAADGTIIGGLSVTEDITDDIARQDQLEQIHRLSRVGTARYDARSGWVLEADLLGLWGMERYDKDQFRETLLVPEDRAAVLSVWEEVMVHSGVVTTPYRIHHAVTGELRHLEMIMQTEVDQDGTLIRSVATHIDVTASVTDREAAERARREAATQRTVLLRQVSDTLGTSRQGVAELARTITDLAAGVVGEGAILRIMRTLTPSVAQDFVAHADPQALPALASSVASTADTPATNSAMRDTLVKGSLISTITADEHHETYRQMLAERVGVPVEHYIVAPARFEGMVYGVIVVYRVTGSRPYERGDDDLLQILADRIGNAIATEWAREQAERERLERDAVADRLRVLTDEQSELLAQLAETETRERSLLAEAVHDDPLQLIVAAILRVDLLRLHEGAVDDDELDGIATLLETSVERLRQLIVALAPLDLSEGLGAALRRLAEGVFVGTSVAVQVSGAQHVDLSAPTKNAAYRIAREALVNARKHACGSRVDLRLVQQDDQVVLSVSDDGVGALSLEAGPGHLGLVTMRARALAEGADLRIDSEPGRGTTVTATFPVAERTTALG